MQYRTLGTSGCVVSHLCLGAMTFGDEADEARHRAEQKLSTRREEGFSVGNLVELQMAQRKIEELESTRYSVRRRTVTPWIEVD